MVWKSGKFGVNNGRTVRSRTHGKRSEGLLIHTRAPRERGKDEAEVITYSLGKQNRWLLPEVIKTADSVEFDKDDVVLVERFTSGGTDRPNCFSVYSSKDSTTRKSKRGLARTTDLLIDIEETETRFEVSYPHPLGSWRNEKQRKSQASRLGTRKKNSLVFWSIEEDFEEVVEPDLSFHYVEEDLNDLCHSSNIDRSITVDFEKLIKPSSRKKISRTEELKTSQQMKKDDGTTERALPKRECIYVESEHDMYDAHHELLTQIRETSYHYNNYDNYYDPYMNDWGEHDGWPERGRGGWRGGRGRGRGRGRGGFQHYTQVEPDLPSPGSNTIQHHVPNHAASPTAISDLSSNLPQLSATDPCPEYLSLLVNHEETNPVFLEEIWGAKYLEAASVPRAFVLNATPKTSQDSSGEVFVLFRLGSDKTNLSMIVICSDEHMHGPVLSNFTSEIKARNAKEDVCSLEDVVNIARKCFCCNTDNKVDIAEPRQPKLSLDVFAELFGWKSRVFTLQKARQEVKVSPEKEKCHLQNRNAVVSNGMECGICFMEMQFNDADFSSCYTSLNACGHKFCNDCWRAHLKTQIDLGQTKLRCPGHECSTAVDDVTLMSLVPSLYARHLTKRLDTILEMSPKWKWCPKDRCKLVVKATMPQDHSEVCDAEHNGSVQPVPVACVCGTMWCFKCQEDAHWPATCEEARVFRKKNEGYAKMVENSQNDTLITSVDVKNCPFCKYPIQKGPGCNHMQCGLCNEEFCWYCLQKWSYDHVCDGKVMQRQVDLPVNTKHMRSYEHYAVTCHLARSPVLVQRISKKLENLEKGQQFYGTIWSPRVNKSKPRCSSAKRLLNYLCESHTTQDLREVFGFKFQAHLALEGLAIVLSFTRDSPNKRLALEFERLLFIEERLNDLLQDFEKCFCQETLERTKHFVACGKNCLFVVDRNTKQFINSSEL